jgi:hypothetical protein
MFADAKSFVVIPAKAGIQGRLMSLVLNSRFRGDDEKFQPNRIPF